MYFNMEDVRDALLQPNLSDEDVAESTEYVDGLAARLGVSPERIRTPVAYPIRQLALFYALMVCARNASDMTSGRSMEAGEDPMRRSVRFMSGSICAGKRESVRKHSREQKGKTLARISL